jgi:hypothetical protein
MLVSLPGALTLRAELLVRADAAAEDLTELIKRQMR